MHDAQGVQLQPHPISPICTAATRAVRYRSSARSKQGRRARASGCSSSRAAFGESTRSWARRGRRALRQGHHRGNGGRRAGSLLPVTDIADGTVCARRHHRSRNGATVSLEIVTVRGASRRKSAAEYHCPRSRERGQAALKGRGHAQGHSSYGIACSPRS